jgi:hypothetical protein
MTRGDRDSLGPVNSVCLGTLLPSWTSFEIKSDRKHNAGCRKSLKSMKASSLSTSVGRHLGSSKSAEALANESKQSSSAKILLEMRISGLQSSVVQRHTSILVEFLQQIREETLKGDFSRFSCFLYLADEWLSLSGDIFVLRLL